jgi:hypothetical protein
MEIKMSETEWETVDFQAAPAGWLCRITLSDGRERSMPIAGWLRQQGPDYSSRRRVVAAVVSDDWNGELEPLGEHTSRVMAAQAVYAPGDDEPVYCDIAGPGQSNWANGVGE